MAALFTLSSVSVMASPQWCGYTDFFHPSSDSPKNLHILAISGDSNVKVTKRSSSTFTISDVPSCPPNGGYATVLYGTDAQHVCTLTIHDGELMNDPDTTAKCNGLQFNGQTYDGTLTYRYTLHFSK